MKDLEAQRTEKNGSFVRWPGLLLIAIVLAAVIYFGNFGFMFFRSKQSSWPTTEAQLLNTKISLVDAVDAAESHPSTICYRLDADVRYRVNGQTYEGWHSASEVTTARQDLEWIAAHRKQATVRWKPSQPDFAYVILK